MTRHRVIVPGDLRTVVIFGYDRSAVAFFLTVLQGARRLVDVDGLSGMDGLDDLMRALARTGLISDGDIAEAMLRLPHDPVADIGDPKVRLAAEIIQQLRADAQA